MVVKLFPYSRQRLYGWWSEDECGRIPDGAAGEKHKQRMVLIEREKYLRKKLRDAQAKNEFSLEHARHQNLQPLIAVRFSLLTFLIYFRLLVTQILVKRH
jgi:hypothetical protein